jgi:serine/threonine protein kinase
MIRDRYRIGRVLGQPGGFGVTYLAFDERLHTHVAIKEYMPRDVAGRATSDGSEVWSSGGHEETFQHGLDQFLREARTLAQFDHPNVVGVSNYFETNGTGYLVMDYYEGRTVTQRLSDEPDGRMAPETASGIIEEVANGLREVHAEGYLHRDIKPSNIYLTQEGRPILIDFGAARAALGEHSQNLSVLVSPGYAPYEQYRMRGDLGPYTDVYSCGATLYWMVTGTVPEPASERIVDDKLEPPRILNPEVPPELSTVIEEAMAVDGEDRPPTAAVLQERLRAVTYETKDEQRSTAPEARSPEPPVRDASPERSASASTGAPQWATTLLGVLVVALFGLGGWADYQYGLVGLLPAEPSSPPPSIAEAGDETSPSEDNSELTDGSSGEENSGDEPGGSSGSDGGQPDGNQAGDSGSENDQSGFDGNESSSRGQSEDSDQAPDEDFGDYAGNEDGEDESESDETQGRSDESMGDSAGSDRNDSETGNKQEADGSATGSSEESEETLGAKAVAVVQEGEHADRQISHDAFKRSFRIERVEETDKVGTEIKLSSGALLTVDPEGRFTYAPNGAFRDLDAGEDTTDRFTYTAVSESGDQKLRGTVKVPIRGENTPPELKGTGELTLRAEQVSPIPSRVLKATDPDDEAEELRFTVTEGPTRGEIRVGESLASADTAFTQRDVEEGRVFYADTTGEAGEDTFTVAVRDANGERAEGALQVRIEPAEAQKT